MLRFLPVISSYVISPVTLRFPRTLRSLAKVPIPLTYNLLVVVTPVIFAPN
jgi:hypothetical protein